MPRLNMFNLPNANQNTTSQPSANTSIAIGIRPAALKAPQVLNWA